MLKKRLKSGREDDWEWNSNDRPGIFSLLARQLNSRFIPTKRNRSSLSLTCQTSYQNQQSQSDLWYSIIPQQFKMNLFEENTNHVMVQFDGNLRSRCHSLQLNIYKGIWQYRQEQKLLARILDATRRHQIQQEHESRPISKRILARNSNLAKETLENETNISEDQLKIYVQEQKDRLMRLEQSRIPYLSRMYELKATTADATLLPVKICGFVMTEENIYEILFALVREKILPEGKQFIVNYFYYTPRELVEIVLDGINSLVSDKQICELITFENEDYTAGILENFVKGDLRGIFLPLDRGFLQHECEIVMANTEYMINFFTIRTPLIENPTMKEDRVKDYWKRVDYSKHVKGSHRPLTVVDFVPPVHLFQYKDMYRQKGFVVDLVTVHNFEANSEQIQPPLVQVFRQSLYTDFGSAKVVTSKPASTKSKEEIPVQQIKSAPGVSKPMTKICEDNGPLHQNQSETQKITVCKPIPVTTEVKIAPIHQNKSDSTKTVFSKPKPIPVIGEIKVSVQQKSEVPKPVLAESEVHVQTSKSVTQTIPLSKRIPVIGEIKTLDQEKSEAPEAVFFKPIPVISNMRTKSPAQPNKLTSTANPRKRSNLEVGNHILNGHDPISKSKGTVQTSSVFEVNDGPLLEVSFFRDYGHTHSDFESSDSDNQNPKKTRQNITEDQVSNSNGSTNDSIQQQYPDFQDPLYYSFNSYMTNLYPHDKSAMSPLRSTHETSENQNCCSSTYNGLDMSFERRQRYNYK